MLAATFTHIAAISCPDGHGVLDDSRLIASALCCLKGCGPAVENERGETAYSDCDPDGDGLCNWGCTESDKGGYDGDATLDDESCYQHTNSSSPPPPPPPRPEPEPEPAPAPPLVGRRRQQTRNLRTRGRPKSQRRHMQANNEPPGGEMKPPGITSKKQVYPRDPKSTYTSLGALYAPVS